MKKERILYAILFVVFLAYVVVEHYAPKPLDWTPTYSQNDKNPFGGYILYDRLNDLFEGDKTLSFQTLYEIQDSSAHILILANEFEPNKEDFASLMKLLEAGNDVFIGAESFSSQFLDTLEINGIDFQFPEVEYIFDQDSLDVHFGEETFRYPFTILKSNFQLSDTSNWVVHASSGSPVLISQVFGNGKLILSSTPLAFTNYGILLAENYKFTERSLNLLSNGRIFYNRFYQAGRAEPQTPLRYMLSQAPLKWAVFLMVFGLLILLIVDSQRRQRAIPLMDPNTNTTVRYIKTIGGLFYRERNHKVVAMKLIVHFQKMLKERYFMPSPESDSGYKTLAAKSGVPVSEVIKTFDLMNTIRNSRGVSETELKNLNHGIKQFEIN